MRHAFALLAVVSLAACGDDTGTGGGATTSTTGTTVTTGNGASSSGSTKAASTTATGSGSTATATSSSTGGMNAAQGSFVPGQDAGNLAGTVAFTVSGTDVTLTVNITAGLTEGMHGIHIHQNGECDPATGFNSAGAHWNPGNPQGEMTVANGWLGELGQIAIDANGAGTFTLTTDKWTVGGGAMSDVLGGHSIVVHADPMGGTRLGCAVIEAP